MSCDNLIIPSPLITKTLSSLFGIPYQAAGRVINSTAYPISGIVLHCYPGTLAELSNEMKCRTRSSVVSGTWENSFHYGIGAASSSGNIVQFVEDGNVSWGFGTYKANTYATPPPPNIAINWPELQGEFGINTTPDLYVLNIALAIGHIVEATLQGCYDCPTASGLQQNQHDQLVQLLAYLAQEYGIPIDAEHITFHDLIHCGEGEECPCTNIETLLAEVAAFCPPCPEEGFTAPEAAANDEITHIYGVTEPCCPTSPGCLVQIPWDGCFIGDLATDGNLTDYILGLNMNASGQLCLTRGCIALMSPLIGCGTTADPIRLDLCAFGDWVPDEVPANVVNILGIDAAGCLVETGAADWFCEWESPITPIDTLSIDLTVSGECDHTLQADLIISPQAGNQLELLADGVYVGPLDCADMTALFASAGAIQILFGVDPTGACVQQTVAEMIQDAFMVADTDCIGLNWAAGVLTATPIIDPAADNMLTCEATGLYVPQMTFSGSNSCINLTLVGNELSVDLVVDPAADNITQCTVNGVYTPDLTVTDTDCMNLTYVGRDLSVEPIISGAIGGNLNVLTCQATGLYVQRGADAAVNGPLTGNGSDTNPLDIDFGLMTAQDLCDFGENIPSGTLVDIIGRDGAECLRRQTIEDVISAALVAGDTSCIDLTLTGNILTADPIISGTIGGVPNALSCLGSGLYVPQGAGLVTNNTNCATIDITNGVITVDVVVDPSGQNQLICGASGLYVPPVAGLQVSDTDCLNLNLVGTTLSGTITLAGPQGGVPNIVSCITGQGLYVPETAGLSVIDTTCIDLDLTGGVLQANIIIDPTGDNQIQCLPAGLYVPPVAGLVATDTDCITLNLAGDILTATPILAPAQGGVANGLTCIAGQGLYVPQCPPITITAVQNLAGVFPRIVYDQATCTINIPQEIVARITNNLANGITVPIPQNIWTPVSAGFTVTNTDTTGGAALAGPAGTLTIPTTGVYDIDTYISFAPGAVVPGDAIALGITLNGAVTRIVTTPITNLGTAPLGLLNFLSQSPRTAGDVIGISVLTDNVGGSVTGASISIKQLEM